MLITEAVTSPTFANHESFHLRLEWLKKAYDRVLEDSQIFTTDSATIKLGVGKNMVRSIRHWSLAHKIIETSNTKSNSPLRPSRIGEIIFGDGGLDPYLENPTTLWLLHWLLYVQPCRVPVWWLIMNEFTATNAKIEEITESVFSRVTNINEWKTPSPKSIKKDIDVFIHTYTTYRDRSTVESYMDCPFSQMGMIDQGSRDALRFVYGIKEDLSPLIVAYACLDFMARSETNAKTISVSRLATEAGSVGNIFKITENDLVELLREASKKSDLSLINNNGTYQLKSNSAKEQSEILLAAAYGRKQKTVKRRKVGVLAR